MEPIDPQVLKEILEHVHHPDALNSHTWAASLFVRDAVERHPHLRSAKPGRQLIAALCELFAQTRPSTPPRRGKRLDTRWGEFGLLAALYFAPQQFGAPVPSSLRDAWGRIDESILFYVNGHEPAQNGMDTQRLRDMYGLVRPEPEVAPISTLSDWHRKGIERLADTVLAREKYLADPPAGLSPLEGSLAPSQVRQASRPKKPGRLRKPILASLALVVIVFLALGLYKGRQIYEQARTVRNDVLQVRGLLGSSMGVRTISEGGPLLTKTRQDFQFLSAQVKPFLWLGPWLSWVPVYGGDLASSRDILQMADLLLESADTAVTASQPIVAMLASDGNLDPSQIVLALNQAGPELTQARGALEQAMQLRAGLDAEQLSPQTRLLIEEDLDRLLPMMDEGLAITTALPHILGATSEGPKTYLLLVQNEDELRPTGGFITGVGTLVVQNGQVLSLSFVNSGEMDNWDMPYPQAPWQLEQYMNSPVLILRDANWFPDFPTSALYAESMYAYINSHSVDGVIAFDQHMLVSILEALGPLHVEGAPGPIDAGNIISYMRSAKVRPADQLASRDWSNKSFMDTIAKAMLLKIFQGEGVSWEHLGSAFLQGLNQNHLLLQLDDPTVARVIARHGWDGALRYPGGDFLLVVDSNVGFNKTNAVVNTSLSYDVDLTDPAHPIGTLTVTHQNNASPEVDCVQWQGPRLAGQEEYPIDACYWNYMRVYVPAGVALLDATPQSVPDAWMILDRGVDGPVDVLEEELEGLQGFGALMVVPGGEFHVSSFRFRLPDPILLTDGDQTGYRLRVEKQPGTGAVPIIVRVHLPHGASLKTSVPAAIVDGNHLYFETNLSTDLDLALDFQLK